MKDRFCNFVEKIKDLVDMTIKPEIMNMWFSRMETKDGNSADDVTGKLTLACSRSHHSHILC